MISSSIWEVRADGTNLHLLLPGWNDAPAEFMGTWVFDGQYFIFGSRVDERTDLWALRETHGFLDWTHPKPVRLTDGPLSYEEPPMVTSGDSTVLAEAVQRKGEVVRYDFATHRLLPFLNGLSAVDVAFSPDRKSVVYSSWPARRLWGAASDGTGPHQLVKDPAEMDSPAWSPDNKWIAFTSRLAGKHLKIFLMPADGSGPPKAISPEDQEQGAPSWSLDGRRFCFGDVPEQPVTRNPTEVLHIYDLTTHVISDVPGSQGLWTCRWSPDGRHLAAVKLRRQPKDVVRLSIFDLRTETWTELPNTLHVNNPSWSLHSTFIYYDTEGDEFSLRRVRLADDTVETLALPPGFAPATQWSGLAPDDSPLLLRDASTRNVYALKFERR
jgi:Tol biopolymer transport system component